MQNKKAGTRSDVRAPPGRASRRWWHAAALVTAALVWATPVGAVTLDGSIGMDEWADAGVIITDPDETLVTNNNFDVRQILMHGGNRLHVALTVYGSGPELASVAGSPYLSLYFSIKAGAGSERYGLTWGGHGLPAGEVHLIQLNGSWRDLGAVPHALGEALEIAVPWERLAVVPGPSLEVADFFFVYNVQPGDANNDGRVDVGDLGILGANYGRTSGGTWAGGDFNLDGRVDVGDLGILGARYGYVNTSGTLYDMFDEATLVERNTALPTHTPEPVTILGVVMAGAAVGGYWNHRRKAHKGQT